MWVHGGSFCCGDKTSPEIVDEANTFARKGYFNVSINYRLEPGGCSAGGPTADLLTAIQEARDDAKTAVRFLRTNAALYGIDETRIAIGGSSAGAITALNVGFTSSEDPPAAVAGAVSLSGAAILSGGTIGAGDAPSLLFHGTADTVVPYQWAVNTWNDGERRRPRLLPHVVGRRRSRPVRAAPDRDPRSDHELPLLGARSGERGAVSRSRDRPKSLVRRRRRRHMLWWRRLR